jgi:16S rRNA (cytosine967-C5)-methyltransferase
MEEKRPFSMRAGGGESARSGAIWAWQDLQYVSSAVKSLFRWWGWIEPLGPLSTPERLLLATLLDSPAVDPVARVWARVCGRQADSLLALKDAPNWTARTEGFKRNAQRTNPLVDPWALFPAWFRSEVPLPPGESPPKQRAIAWIESLQTPQRLWVRAQSEPPERIWNELRDQGLKPWTHRRITEAARLDLQVEISHLAPVERGALEIQDLAAQAVGRIAAPRPGQRWWVISPGRGSTAGHLAALMNGKGLVVASDRNAAALKSLALHIRRTPYRNLTTRVWDGKGVAGKPGSFDGVLITPSSSEVGLWRRFPDARWRFDPSHISQLAQEQSALLDYAALGVGPGGILVYAVPTLTSRETNEVISSFLQSHDAFALDPFSDPLTGVSTDGTLRIWPYEADSDAWFVARLKRLS